MSNIKCVKLITGEDIIADYSISDDGIVKLENPVQVSMVPTRTGEPNFGFIPFPLPSNDKVIYIRDDKLIFVCEPADEFITQYNSIFGAGIIAPSKKLII